MGRHGLRNLLKKKRQRRCRISELDAASAMTLLQRFKPCRARWPHLPQAEFIERNPSVSVLIWPPLTTHCTGPLTTFAAGEFDRSAAGRP